MLGASQMAGMTRWRRSKCPEPAAHADEPIQVTTARDGAHQHDAVYLKPEIDRVKKHDDCRYDNLAKGYNHLPEIEVNVVAMCQEIERAVRRRPCEQASKPKHEQCVRGQQTRSVENGFVTAS